MLRHTGRQTAERLSSIARHCYFSRLQQSHPDHDGDGLYDNAEEREEGHDERSLPRKTPRRSPSQSVDTLSVISMATEDVTLDTTDLEDTVTVHCDANSD